MCKVAIKPFATVVAALCLTACVEGNDARKDILTGNTYAHGMFEIVPVDPDYPRAGMTYASSDFFHGLQVEYFSPDGKVYLWYPGNVRSVVGEWTAEKNDLCFRYQPNSYNPVTGQRGGAWECRNRAREKIALVSKADGDPFQLKSGRVPAHDLRTCRLPGGMKQYGQMRCLPKA